MSYAGTGQKEKKSVEEKGSVLTDLFLRVYTNIFSNS